MVEPISPEERAVFDHLAERFVAAEPEGYLRGLFSMAVGLGILPFEDVEVAAITDRTNDQLGLVRGYRYLAMRSIAWADQRIEQIERGG